MPRCAAFLSRVLLAAGLLLAAPALAGPLTALPAGTAQPAPAGATPTAATPPDEATSLRHLLDAAQAEQAANENAAEPPPGASPEEVLERKYLLGELIAALERHLDMLARLPEARQRATEEQARTEAWTPPATTAPASLMAVDRQREMLDDTRARLKNIAVREGFFDQQATEAEKTLKAAEVDARQADERIAGALPDKEKARQIWLRDLARLRARTAAAVIDEAKASKTLIAAETAELQARAQRQQKQLGLLDRDKRFTQADLDGVLADLDKQVDDLEAKRVKLQTASARSHQLLDQARRRLDEAKAAPPGGDAKAAADLRARLERDLAIQRLRVDTDDLAYDILRRTIDARGWERAAWQMRWYLYNRGDQEKLRDSQAKLAEIIQQLDGWSRYLQDEINRLRQQADAAGPPPAGALDADAQMAEAMRAAYRQRVDILSDARKAADNLLHTLRAWVSDIQDNDQQRGWREILDDGWDQARQAARAVWNFELFTSEDTMEVEGRRITATRSITVGKSLGVILLVVIGSLISSQVMRRFRHIAIRYFRVTANHAATLGRWTHIVIVCLLFFIALYLANIPLTVFAFLGGALAIGVGFGTQVMLKNMISGVMLLVERPLRVGDIVEVGSVHGTVTQINIRSSTVRTSDGIEILVPNSTFIENNVTNWTYSNAQVRCSVSVGTDYSAPPETVAALLMDIAHRHPAVLKEPGPRVLLDSFGADAINFTLRYWIDYAQGTDSSQTASEIRFMIAAALAKAGIDIPLPQRVVHLKTEAAPAAAQPQKEPAKQPEPEGV